jgi:transposase-like protein
MIHILSLIDETKGIKTVRALRWPGGVHCPTCDSSQIAAQKHDETPPVRQRYRCKSCGRRFGEVTDRIVAGHHRPLRVWMLGLDFVGLHLSHRHRAQELDLNTEVGLR